MPLHIPITVYPSLSSSNSINATPSSSSSIQSSPSSNSSSSLIEERFIPPTSSQGVWIRIKGYTQHLSPIGQRYARELPNKIGIEANEYTETLLEDRDGVLKVEALKDGKVLAVVNSRLTRDEEQAYYSFVSTSSSLTPCTRSTEEEDEGGVRRSNWVNRRIEEDGRIRFNRRTIIQDEPEEEEEDEEEDYSDLPPLVSLAPGESFYSNSTSTAQPEEHSEALSTLFDMPDVTPESRRLVFSSSSPHNLPLRQSSQSQSHPPHPQRDHLFYSHPNSSSYLPPAPAPASPVDEPTQTTTGELIERARPSGEPMDEVEDAIERRTRRGGNETVVLRSMNRYTGWPSSANVRETVGR